MNIEEDIKKLNTKGYLIDISTNIANAYIFDKYKNICKKLGEKFLEIIETSKDYSDALFNLVFAGIPIENIDYDKLIEGSGITAEWIEEKLSERTGVKVKPKPELAIENIISKSKDALISQVWIMALVDLFMLIFLILGIIHL